MAQPAGRSAFDQLGLSETRLGLTRTQGLTAISEPDQTALSRHGAEPDARRASRWPGKAAAARRREQLPTIPTCVGGEAHSPVRAAHRRQLDGNVGDLRVFLRPNAVVDNTAEVLCEVTPDLPGAIVAINRGQDFDSRVGRLRDGHERPKALVPTRAWVL